MNEHVIYAMVASALQRIVDQGVRVVDIADDTHLSASTLRKFMRQDTRRPQFHTLMAILEYLGFELTLHKARKEETRRTATGLRVTHVTGDAR